MANLFMSRWVRALMLVSFALSGCHTHHETPGIVRIEFIEIDSDVRHFMSDAAHDVTQDGPSAWRKYFADTPAFFMVVDGQMAFASGAQATTGIQQVAKSIKQIELKWGDDLRVDPLAPEIAVVAASYREIQMWANGRRVEENGYFTGVVQYRDGRWQFRDCHWSEPVPPPPKQ
jgi:hypothetical protein